MMKRMMKQMTKQIGLMGGLILVLTLLGGPRPGLADDKLPKLPKGKQTTARLYATANEAYKKWQAAPDKVKIIDVRTPEEYMFVGHAPMAHNIPLMLFKDKWYSREKDSPMDKNNDFVAQVKKKCQPTDTIMLMCRSGNRSARAVNMLSAEGFKNVYNIIDGFEGDKLKTGEGPLVGKRVVNGWKNAGLPWTYDTDPKYVFRSVLE